MVGAPGAASHPGDDAPTVSVIIATYNWSEALRCAIASVLAQTMGNFELLVVGDACTDETGAVVESFADARVAWINLPHNHGSQYGPNNAGLARARGRYVAYLGHDDLWWPGHLAAALNVFERTGADIVGSVTALYGPPESGIRAITGLFPEDTYSPRYFFPPSSLLHTRALLERVGPWRGPSEARVAVDQDFLLRCYEAGATVAPTRELTVFKFNAAWRRDSYRDRSASEQQDWLRRIAAGGEDFRRAELMALLQCWVEDRLHRIEYPTHDMPLAQVSHTANASFKGSARASPQCRVELRRGRVLFSPEEAYSGFEWYAEELNPVHGRYRWSGPSRRSSIVFPLDVPQGSRISVCVLEAIDEAMLADIVLELNDVRAPTTLERRDDGTYRLSAVLGETAPADDGEADLKITLVVPRTRRPIDAGKGNDRR
ncbi:glycosyltransferase family 2 protein, partial [Methylobacterium trifolii]